MFSVYPGTLTGVWMALKADYIYPARRKDAVLSCPSRVKSWMMSFFSELSGVCFKLLDFFMLLLEGCMKVCNILFLIKRLPLHWLFLGTAILEMSNYLLVKEAAEFGWMISPSWTPFGLSKLKSFLILVFEQELGWIDGFLAQEDSCLTNSWLLITDWRALMWLGASILLS